MQEIPAKVNTTANNVPRDLSMPSMATALDPEAMRKIFQLRILSQPQCGAAVEARHEIRECTITRVKHKAGKYCQVCYRLTVFDAAKNAERRHILTARVFQKGASASRYQKARRQKLVATALNEPVYHLPELDMVIWVFPNDRKLEKLPLFADESFLRTRVLPEIILSRYGKGWEMTNVQHEIVHYVPELTCTARVEMTVQNNCTDETAAETKPESFTIFGKTFYNAHDGAQSYNNMLQLWESDARKLGCFNMAMPLGYHAATQSLWQVGLQGKTLIELPLASPELINRIASAAECVAALHAIPVTVPDVTNIQIVLNRLEEVRELVFNAWPARTGRTVVNRIVGRLLSLSVHLQQADPVLLHGDLHLKNFFLSREKVYLIDLDNLFHGPAALDLGSFIAGLLYRSKIEGVSPKHIRRLINVFLQAYRQNSAHEISDFEVAWYTAAMLISERVYRCLSRLKAGRLDILHELIALAEETTERMVLQTERSAKVFEKFE